MPAVSSRRPRSGAPRRKPASGTTYTSASVIEMIDRRDAGEWYRRGLRPPHEIHAMTRSRIEYVSAQPCYVDFFETLLLQP